MLYFIMYVVFVALYYCVCCWLTWFRFGLGLVFWWFARLLGLVFVIYFGVTAAPLSNFESFVVLLYFVAFGC